MVDIARVKGLAAAVEHAVEAYSQDDSIANYKQMQTAISRLQTAAATPADTLFTFRLQVVGNVAVIMLIELGIINALVAMGQDQVHLTELAASTGTQEQVVERLMRVASGLGFCEEVDEATYHANELTRHLVQSGWKGALRWMDIIYPMAGKMREYLSTTRFGREPSTPVPATALEYTHSKSTWQVLEESPDQRRNFDLWMRERRKHEETSWHRRYPPSVQLTPGELRSDAEATLMVDVGGAHGSQLVNFRTQFPHLPGRYVLQDLPESVAAVTNKLAEVEVMAYDFFTPQPIKGSRFYYFRNVCNVFHNWPDEKCAEILRNVVPAMDPEYSSLLIDDYVLPSKGAQLRSAIADIHMMAMFDSSERTLRQYEEMLAAAGLEIVAVFPTGPNEEAISEARVRKASTVDREK
ncbi:S-adenosyl-L-methionine-dependent methyltransferase [Aspergillus spinulosporus]